MNKIIKEVKENESFLLRLIRVEQKIETADNRITAIEKKLRKLQSEIREGKKYIMNQGGSKE